MIINSALEKYYLPYTESEQLFKTFYHLIQNKKTTDEFIDSIKNIDVKSFLQNVVDTGNYNFSKKSDLFYIYNEDIVVAKHIRYYPYFMHKHHFYEIVYQLTGSSNHIINNIEVHLNEGNLCIIPPGSFHAVGVFDDSIIVNIIIRPYSIDVLLSDLLPQDNMFSTLFTQTGIINSNINFIYIPISEDLYLQNLIENIVIEDIEKQKHSTSVKKMLIMQCFCHILRHYEEISQISENSNKFPSEVRSICQYLHINYKTADLTSVAKEFGYSSTYLSKLLHSSTGQTFSDIVSKEKLTCACKLLVTTDMKISDIAEAVGYASPEYFNKAFKKSIGVSPSIYRKEYEHYPSRVYTTI